MNKVRALTLIVLAGGLLGIANADTLEIREGVNPATFDAPGKPTRGMSQARVAANFGEPVSRHGAVGDPPITRWDYEGFSVFFEYDKVIHSVSRR